MRSPIWFSLLFVLLCLAGCASSSDDTASAMRDRWVGDWEAVDGDEGWKDNIDLPAEGVPSSFVHGRMTAGGDWAVELDPDHAGYFRLSIHTGQVMVTARLSDDGSTMYVLGTDGKTDVPFKRKVREE